MKTCIYCGTENEDSASQCIACSGVFQTQTASQTKRVKTQNKKAAKWIGIAVGAVAVIAAVGTAVGLLVSNHTLSSLSLSKAAVKTAVAFSDYFDANSNPAKALIDLKERMEDGKYSAELVVDTAGVYLSTDLDYSRSAKVLNGSADIQIPTENVSFALDYSSNTKVFQFAFKEGGYNVYGLKYSTLGKKYGDSFLSGLIPAEKLENAGKQLFQKPDIKNFLDNSAEKEFKALKKSFQIKKINERVVNIGGVSQNCTVYRIEWEEDAAKNLVSALTGRKELTGIAQWLSTVLGKLEPECTCLVNEKGRLIGIDFVSVGVQYEFLLEGKNNIWESFSLTATTASGTQTRYTGGVERSNSVVRVSLQGDSGQLFAAEYDGSTGNLTIEDSSGSVILKARIFTDGEKSVLTLYLNAFSVGEETIQFSVGELKNKPAQLGKEYVDVFEMGLIEWQRLLMNLGISPSMIG